MKYRIKFELNSIKMEMLLETEYPLKGKIKILDIAEIYDDSTLGKEKNPFNGDILKSLKGFKK